MIAPETTAAPTLPRDSRRELDGSPDDYRLPTLSAAAIVLFGATMLAIHLGDVRALTFHETVFAQPAKEMLRDGRWIVPTIAGVPFTDRTPLTAWTIAASMKLCGSQAEWVVRLPSVVFAILTALLIASMAARWFGPRVGLLAGLMDLTTVHVLTQARLAEADMLLCFTVTAAMYAFAAAMVDGPRSKTRGRLPAIVFHAATAASFMVKWVFGPAFIGLGCVAYCAATRERRAWRILLDPVGIAVGLVLTVPWMWAAYREHPQIVAEFVQNHFGRFGGSMGAREPWYAYAYLVPLLLLPWTPYAVLAIASRIRGRRFEPIWILFACWILPGLLLLSFSSFKARHYTIPLLPPLVVAAALGLHECLKRRVAQTNPAWRWLLGTTIGGGAVAAGVTWWKQPAEAAAIIVLTLIITAGIAAAILLERQRRFGRQLSAMFGTAWIAAVGVQTWIMPSHDSFRPLAQLGMRASEHVPAEATVHLVQLPEAQIPFYIDRPLRRCDKLSEFAVAKLDGPAYVVTSRDYVEQLAGLGGVEILDAADRKARHTYDRDRLVLLRITPAATTAGIEANLLR